MSENRSLLLDFSEATQLDVMDLKHGHERYSRTKPESLHFQKIFNELCSRMYRRPQSEQARAMLQHFNAVHAYLCKLPDEIITSRDPSVLLNLAIEEAQNAALLKRYEGLEGLETPKYSDNGVWSLGKFREGWRSNSKGSHWRHSSPNAFR